MARQSLMWTTLPNGYRRRVAAGVGAAVAAPRARRRPRPSSPASSPTGRAGPTRLRGPASRSTTATRRRWSPRARPAGPTGSTPRSGSSIRTPGGRSSRPSSPCAVSSSRTSRTTRCCPTTPPRWRSWSPISIASSAAAPIGELPTVTDIIDRPAWREVLHTVAEIDRRYHDRKQGLRDPRRMFDDFRHDELPVREGATAALARFQLFHNPPSRPRPVTHTRTDDARISARWLEYERKPLPSEEQLAKEIDFHQIVAAMNQYPTLLRRLGLVVDLVLDRRTFADAADAPLWTEVELCAGRAADAPPARRLAGHPRPPGSTAPSTRCQPESRSAGAPGRRRPARPRPEALRSAADRCRRRRPQGDELRPLAHPLRARGPARGVGDPLRTRARRALAAHRRPHARAPRPGHGAGAALRRQPRSQRPRREGLPGPARGGPAGAVGRGSRARLPGRRLGRQDGRLALALPARGALRAGRRRGGGDAGVRRGRHPAPGGHAVARSDRESRPRLPARGAAHLDGLEPRGAAAGARRPARRYRRQDVSGDRGRGACGHPRSRRASGRCRARCRGCASDAATGCGRGSSTSPATPSRRRPRTSDRRIPRKWARPFLRYEPIAPPVIALVRPENGHRPSARPRASPWSAWPSAASTTRRPTTRCPPSRSRGATPCRPRRASATPSSTASWTRPAP